MEAIEQALLVAYHRTEGAQQHARAELDRKSGHVTVFARELNEDGTLAREYDDTPSDFGRIAATTASRSSCSGCATPRTRPSSASTPRPRATSCPASSSRGATRGWSRSTSARSRASCSQEQVPGERYEHGSRIRCLVVDVKKGPSTQVVLSRSHPQLVKKLFALEVPEIADGTVQITALSREAGHRSKMAVRATRGGVNAKGACIGPMGQRVRAVMAELRGEKIDIVDHSDDPAQFVGNALSPRPGSPPWRSSTSRRGRRGWSSPTTSSRWPSARRGRTPGWRPS